jgi:hypothetical protein
MIDKSPRPVSRSTMTKSPRPKPRPEDLMENYNLMRAMEGTESKAIKQDLEAAAEDKKAMGGMVKYMDGGMVRGCKGVQMTGKGFRGTY